MRMQPLYRHDWIGLKSVSAAGLLCSCPVLNQCSLSTTCFVSLFILDMTDLDYATDSSMRRVVSPFCHALGNTCRSRANAGSQLSSSTQEALLRRQRRTRGVHRMLDSGYNRETYRRHDHRILTLASALTAFHLPFAWLR